MIEAMRSDLILEPLNPESLESGLIVSERLRKENQGFKGKVISVGPKHTLGCKVGDTVLYRAHEGKKCGELLCMEERHILALLNRPS